MQKEVLIAESMLLIGLLGLVIWQRRKRELKRWWRAWRAKLSKTNGENDPSERIPAPGGAANRGRQPLRRISKLSDSFE